MAVRDMADGGTWNTLAGQPTDDSEMALILARSLVAQGKFDPEEVKKGYLYWLDSGPFDVGNTVSSGLSGWHIQGSQANGAMMRISPLGIFGVNYTLEEVAAWARQDSAITHIHPVCLEANALFAMAITHAVGTGCGAGELYSQIVGWAQEMDARASLKETIAGAADSPPDDFVDKMGWVLIALRNGAFGSCYMPKM